MNLRILNALQQGATVVTGSRRLAHTLGREYGATRQADSLAAWPSPAILPWNAWLAALWEELQFGSSHPPVRLGEWQELVLWERAIRESPGANELLQVSAAAESAREAWALATEWRVDLARVASEGHEDARAFAQWAARFAALCDEQGWVESARVPDCLRDAAAALRLTARVLLVGFDEFSPQQRELIEACRGAGCAIETVDLAPPVAGSYAVRVPLADAGQEIEAAARWTRALLESGAPGNIAVVVPDLAARPKQVERVFRAILEPGSELSAGAGPSRVVNLSAGQPLASYPLVRSALAVLALSAHDNEWQDAGAFIRDRHLAGAETERTARALLEAGLREKGLVRVTLGEMRQLALRNGHCPVLEGILARWLRASEGVPATQTAGQWCRIFSAMLEAVGWPGERPLNSTEYQTVEAWRKALSGFAAVDFAAGDMRKGEALSLLTRIAGRTMFQPESPQAPVQVLGALESTGLRFDHLWVAGLTDEAWPRTAAPNPFLPVRLQREAGVPRCSPERELAFASLVTERLLASSPDIVLSYPAAEGDRELAPSPLILSVEKGDIADLTLWRGETCTAVIRESRAVERLVDEQAPPLGEAAWQRGGAKVFQYQAGCPFRAFAELRLGAEELDTPVPGLGARERGMVVHAALEAVWTEVRTHEALCRRDDIPEVIRKAVAAAVARLEDDRGAPLPERFAALERRRLARIVAEWLAAEKRREPFEVVRPEGERQAEVGGIRFRVRIDRIDRLGDGREVIIDYKTGSPSPRGWDTERPEEPQLPLYSTIHDAPLAGVLFGQVKAGDVRFRGLVDEAVIIPGADSTDLAARIAEWRDVLARLGEDFRTGHAEADPKNPAKSCRYCALAALCRIGETEDMEGSEA